MIDLRALLEQANVRRALVVDDAYDAVPLASDLSIDADEWTQYFEDANENDKAILRGFYAEYDSTPANELSSRDDFVAALWNNRAALRPEHIDPLFARYITDTAADHVHLKALVERLGEYGLECDTAGRAFHDKAAIADLIVIDLFLGSGQTPSDIEISVAGLVQVISNRSEKPPLVVLMSRSSRLDEKREEFREKSGLFESTFRIIRKADIVNPRKLMRLLTRLATHYGDSLKLATFLRAWQSGLDNARGRTANLIRRLDLADLAQIKHMLLSAEGEPTGSYLVDVFDRVLQHEIEREGPIIDAAIALNALTSDSYPPPYVTGSADLQDLVYRCLFQNPERMRLAGAVGSRIAFGDILMRKGAQSVAQGAAAAPATKPLPDVGDDDVLAVMTPACDLQRQGANRVLLLSGTSKPLQAIDWLYKENPVRTPIAEIAGGAKRWIKWDFKNLRMLTYDEFDQVLSNPIGLRLFARLRESHALELQQKLLSNMGRVGLIAPMPATFPMRVEAYMPAPDGKLVKLAVPALAEPECVCYVGSLGLKNTRLVLTEGACEAICEQLASVELATVHSNSQDALKYIRDTGELLQALERGIPLPSPENRDYKDVESPTGAKVGEGANAKTRVIALITRNKEMADVILSKRDLPKAGVVIATWDKENLVPEI